MHSAAIMEGVPRADFSVELTLMYVEMQMVVAELVVFGLEDAGTQGTLPS